MDLVVMSIPAAGKVSEQVDNRLRYEKDEFVTQALPMLIEKLTAHDWIRQRRYFGRLECAGQVGSLGQDAIDVVAGNLKALLERAGYAEVSVRAVKAPRTPPVNELIWQTCRSGDDKMFYFCCLCPLVEAACFPRYMYRRSKNQRIREHNKDLESHFTLHISAALPPYKE
jgi:hypothetical protein